MQQIAIQEVKKGDKIFQVVPGCPCELLGIAMDDACCCSEDAEQLMWQIFLTDGCIRQKFGMKDDVCMVERKGR